MFYRILPEKDEPILSKMKADSIAIIGSILDTPNYRDALPRSDYRECGELALLMLGEKPKRWDKPRFQSCGNFSHARWMYLLLFGPKMLAFSEQVDWIDQDYVQKLERFLTYTSYIHVRYWLTASWSVDQPFLQLSLVKDLMEFRRIDEELADVLLAKLNKNHTWMLSQEFSPVVLCSSLISDDLKSQIAAKILTFPAPDLDDIPTGRPDLPLIEESTSLPDLIGERSHTLFLITKCGGFLELNVDQWEDNPDFQKFNQIMCHTKVVNDAAEHGVKMLQDYLLILTRDDSHRNDILTLVDHNRKLL